MIVATKIAVFWDVAPYCLVYTRRCFRKTCCLFISVTTICFKRREQKEKCLQVLVKYLYGKRQLGRSKCRWDDAIKIKNITGEAKHGLIMVRIGISGGLF
jgi:hypothetical protein